MALFPVLLAHGGGGGDKVPEDHPVNEELRRQGYPPIRKGPLNDAAVAAWRRMNDALDELNETGELTEQVVLAVQNFCHCLKCPSYPRGEMGVYCLREKSDYTINPMNCLCPTCEVYKTGKLQGADYFCMTGPREAKLEASHGGAAGVAEALLQMEREKGNPGKRLPEALMAPPQHAGATQDAVDAPGYLKYAER